MSTKRIGEQYEDYVIVDTTRNDKGILQYVAECEKCGNIRVKAIAGFRRVDNTHSFAICGESYFKASPLQSDYEFISKSKQSNESNKVLYDIKCKVCDNIKALPIDAIQRNEYHHNVINCGEQVREELVGKVFGDLKIIKYNGVRKTDKSQNSTYLCECQICGRQKVAQIGNLKAGKGITHEFCSHLIDRSALHFQTFHKKWADMRQRTENPNNERYSAYGGRGIKSDEFAHFIDFYDALYESFTAYVDEYGIDNTTLERIDVDGDYTKENCTWATWDEQFNNKQNTIYFKVTAPDGSISYHRNVSDFEKENDIPNKVVFNRLSGIVQTNEYNGYTFERLEDDN